MLRSECCPQGGTQVQLNGTGGGPSFYPASVMGVIADFGSRSTAALGSFSNLPPILGCNHIMRII
jgi:hypothetical protein